MFKWSISAEAFVKAQPSDVWSIWIDVSAWPKWDHEIVGCSYTILKYKSICPLQQLELD